VIVADLIRDSDALDGHEPPHLDYDCWTILYGEGYGQKIQKGGGATTTRTMSTSFSSMFSYAMSSPHGIM